MPYIFDLYQDSRRFRLLQKSYKTKTKDANMSIIVKVIGSIASLRRLAMIIWNIAEDPELDFPHIGTGRVDNHIKSDTSFTFHLMGCFQCKETEVGVKSLAPSEVYLPDVKDSIEVSTDIITKINSKAYYSTLFDCFAEKGGNLKVVSLPVVDCYSDNYWDDGEGQTDDNDYYPMLIEGDAESLRFLAMTLFSFCEDQVNKEIFLGLDGSGASCFHPESTVGLYFKKD